MLSYCLFCRSGSEKAVAQVINTQKDTFTALSPRRILRENRQGKWITREVSLLPGYVFLYTEEPCGMADIHAKDLYRILQYEKGIRHLQNQDEVYAQWIFRNHGEIGISRLVANGDQITVIDGPLKDCQGKILKVNKHKRRALVEFDLFNQKQRVSLSVECVSVVPPDII